MQPKWTPLQGERDSSNNLAVAAVPRAWGADLYYMFLVQNLSAKFVFLKIEEIKGRERVSRADVPLLRPPLAEVECIGHGAFVLTSHCFDYNPSTPALGGAQGRRSKLG